MKLTLLAVLTCTLLTACGGSSSSSPEPTSTPTPTPPPSQSYDFDDVRESMKISRVFNPGTAISVAVSKGGEIIFAESQGENLSGASDITSETQFQLGSTQKMFTALGLLKLASQGSLSLDDELLTHLPNIQYLPEDANLWASITLHDLLSQQSGLLDWNVFDADVVGTDLTDFAINGYPQYSPMTKAGQWYSYTNPSYVYAGALIERLTDSDYANWMKQEIFLPLQMSLTTMDRTEVENRGNFALPTDAEGNFLPSISDVPLDTVGLAAGTATWSTPSDVLKMAHFLFNGNEAILTDAYRDLLTEKHIPMDEFGADFRAYGYGIMIKDGYLKDSETYYPIALWEHGGGTDYYASEFYMFPEHDVAVSILSNNEDAEHEEVMLAVLRTLEILPEPIPAPLAQVDESRFSDYTGTFRGRSLWGDLVVHITTEDGVLIVNVPGLSLDDNQYVPVLQPMAGQTLMFHSDVMGSHNFTFRDIDADGTMDAITSRTLVLYRDGYVPE